MKEYLKQSGFLPAIWLETICPQWIAAFFASLFLLSSLGLIALFLLQGNQSFLGASKILFATGAIFGLYRMFLRSLKGRTQVCLAEDLKLRRYGRFMEFNIAMVLWKADKAGMVSGNSVLQEFVKHPDGRWVLSHIGDYHVIAGRLLALAPFSFHPSELLSKMFERMAKTNRMVFGWDDLVLGMGDLSDNVKKVLFDLNIKDSDLEAVASWRRRRVEKSRRSYWSDQKLLEVKGVGKDWSAGFAPNLDQASRDITEEERIYKTPLHMHGHRRYVEMIEKTLVSGVHNAIVVGLPGVGRHTVVKALASAINWGKTYGPLRYCRLLQIDSAAILSHTKTSAEALDRIRLLFNEALWAENVILVVNDIDAFFDSGSVEIGRINATEALLPYLKSKLRIIGLTSPRMYQETVGKDLELVKLFSVVRVEEPLEQETLGILEDEAGDVEFRNRIIIRYPALKEVVNLSSRLIQNLPNPEKSLEVLDSAVMELGESGGKVLTEKIVQSVISRRTQVPVEMVGGAEKEILLHMEEYLKRRVIGQEEALVEVADALRRARAGVRSEKRPIGSFLFLGPTGVGKTETTKALASLYFGSEDKLIRFDMSEYKETSSINRLIGDRTARQNGLLTEAIIASPFSVILLDELEKAHPSVLDLFLQVLDDGRLTDAAGRTVSFSNTLIIATSNAGSELIRQMVKKGKSPDDKNKILDYLQSKNYYRPEFLNRFDGVILFSPLERPDLCKIAELLLCDLNNRLKPKEISINITPELLDYVVKNAHSPEFGARPLRRFIQENFENYIAKGLLSGEIQRGQLVDFSRIIA